MKSNRTLSVFFISMINVAAICSIKNWPITAQYGFSSVFYFLIASIFFFIPSALVSAELATGWPERGGVFAWVKAAFGHRVGFLAVWLQWATNISWYPTILSFIAATIAYTFNPELASNTYFMFATVLIIFWASTFVNMLGMQTSGWISTLGVILGTIVPGIVIIVLGLVWFTTGEPSHITVSWESFIPDLSSASRMALLAGILLSFAGMEMSAAHAREVKNPQRDFPRAILLSTIIILILSVLGTLAIAVVIPKGQISLVSGGLKAIDIFLTSYNLGWAVPLVSILIAIGAIGSVVTWAVGPSKGLLAAAQHGDLPPVLHKVNKKNAPVGMMIFQAIVVSFVSLIFFFMPTVSSSFWILLDLAAQTYLVMYILMFAAAIYLRYKHPDVKRAYRVPGGNIGMWIVAGMGFFGSLFALIMGFWPPEQLETGSPTFFVSFLIIGLVTLYLAPFIVLLFKKPSWNEINNSK